MQERRSGIDKADDDMVEAPLIDQAADTEKRQDFLTICQETRVADTVSSATVMLVQAMRKSWEKDGIEADMIARPPGDASTPASS